MRKLVKARPPLKRAGAAGKNKNSLQFFICMRFTDSFIDKAPYLGALFLDLILPGYIFPIFFSIRKR